MRPGQVLTDAKDQKQRHRAGRQTRRKQQRCHAPYQRGSRRRWSREPVGAHHHHDLVDEYRLAEPDPRHQQEDGLKDAACDRNPARDSHPTLERRRNLFRIWRPGCDGP